MTNPVLDPIENQSALEEANAVISLSEKDTFSLVVAMYNVERYLHDFFQSLEAQKFAFANLDIVLVDDGSTDDTRETAERWASQHPNVVVLSRTNGGQASARNYGLKHAKNNWVCFADPDDMLDADYFSSVFDMMMQPRSADAAIYATKCVYYEEATGQIRDGHPLTGRFSGGNRTVDLRGFPNWIQMQATTAFFRREVLLRHGIEFGIKIRPKFEDAHFVSNYLLHVDAPIVGVVASAIYLYRRRADGTSTMQTSHGHPGSYTDVPRYGLLDILQQAVRVRNTVPRWLQNVILYDIFWYLKSDRAVFSASAALDEAVFVEYHGLIKQILKYIDEEAIMAFDAMPIAAWMRQALAWGYADEPQHTNYALVRPLDTVANLVKLTYRFTGDLPQEAIIIRGKHVQPRHSKIQHLDFLRRTALKERTLWVAAEGTIRLELNGQMVRLVFSEGNRPEFSLLPSKVGQMRLAHKNAVPLRFRREGTTRLEYFQRWAKLHKFKVKRTFKKENLEDILIAMMLRSPSVQKKYGNAWVLMDRDTQANDNAEHLYFWLKKNRPEINAWFVLRRSSADWARLEKRGARLVEYGSFEWKLLMLSAEQYASSHIDKYVVEPLNAKRYGGRRWRFTFLQHGVTKSDLSRWLNPKSLELFITATRPEYDSIVADGSPFRFSTKEVRLTGFPRHDTLLRKRRQVKKPNIILIAPTWRTYLVGKTSNDSATRAENSAFADSAYARHFKELLSSPQLREAAMQHDCEIVFMPHPNTQPYIEHFSLPEYVRVVNYGVDDIQKTIAETAVMVTDYSSVAFDAAYVNSGVVYFQFDFDEYYGGGHSERKGYFEYGRNGFGPVVNTTEEVVAAVSEICDNGGPLPVYAERIDATFPVRDGKNCRRVYNAILDTSKGLSFRQATRPFTPRIEKWMVADEAQNDAEVQLGEGKEVAVLGG